MTRCDYLKGRSEKADNDVSKCQIADEVVGHVVHALVEQDGAYDEAVADHGHDRYGAVEERQEDDYVPFGLDSIVVHVVLDIVDDHVAC